MALKTLLDHYIETSLDSYARETFSWNTDTRQVQRAYKAGGYTGQNPPADVRWPLATPVDTYLVPGPGQPGHDPATVGRTVTVYHNGDGTVSYVPEQACDLAVSNLQATAPASPTGTGSLRFTVATSAAPLQVQVRGANAVLAGQLVDAPAGPLEIPGLRPGGYMLLVQDANGCQNGEQGQSFTVPEYQVVTVPGCTDRAADNYDPAATVDDGSCVYTPVVKQPHFVVPLVSSLRFVQTGGETFDNTLLRNERPLSYVNPGYCQLVETTDTLVLQVQSNYQNAPVCQVRRCDTDAVSATYPAQRVVQGTGESAEFAAYLRPDPTAGKIRVYFNADTLPLPFVAGQRITLAEAGGLNGTYPIQAVLEDVAAAVPYLQLTAVYPTGQQRVDCTLTTTYVVQQFDTYQVVLPFAALSPGRYYVRLSATDPALPEAIALSEPVDVATSHADTLLVAYRNFDNAFQANYTAGLLNRLRVRGEFFRRTSETEDDVLRESDDEPTLLQARLRRLIDFKVFLLPDWLHEKLALAFSHDFVSVNGLRVVRREAYTTTPVARYTLSNGSIVLEQKQLLGPGNRDDLEDVDAGTGQFLIVDNNRLLINS